MRDAWRAAILLCMVGLLPAVAVAQDNALRPALAPTDTLKSGAKWTLVPAERVADVREFDLDEGARAVGEAMAQSTDTEATRTLFGTLSFHEVDVLVKAGRVPADASDRFARGRREMMRQAIEATLREVDPNGTFTVGVLDSGNKNSGIGSDIDQTLVLLPTDPTRPLSMSEADFITALERRFEAMHGFAPARMEVESIDGRDFFPDWRAEHQTLEAFVAEAKRVVEAKRPNNALYRSEAELKVNAEGRGYAELARHFAAVRGLDQRREALLASGRTPAELSADLDRLDAELDQLRAEAPWTEYRLDPSTGEIRVDHESDPRERGFLPNQPEVVRRFAFGGAYDNWFMFESHPDNQPKYVLRSVAEGPGLLTLVRADDGRFDLDRGWNARPFEYEQVYRRGAEGRPVLDAFIADIYGCLDAPAGGITTGRIRLVLDAAARARLRHKRIAPFASMTDREIYADFLPEVRHEGSAADWRLLPEASRVEAARLAWQLDARELMVENLLRTVRAPAELLTGPLDPEEWAAIRQEYPAASPTKLRKAAWLQLFHGFRDLMTVEHAREILADLERGTRPFDAETELRTRTRTTDLVDRLVTELRQMPTSEREVLLAEMEQVLIDAAGSRMELHRIAEPTAAQEIRTRLVEAWQQRLDAAGAWRAEFQRARADLEGGRYADVGQRALDNMVRRMAAAHGDVLNTLGFRGEVLIWSDDPARIPEIVFTPGPDGRGAWDVRRAARNMADAGNAEAMLSVIQAYQQGGASAAARTALQELAMNLPGVSTSATLYGGLIEDRWRDVFQLGVGLAIPVVGQGYVLANVATGLVSVIGHAVLQPLRDDRMDMAYQGFLGAESGLRRDQRSQRGSVLAPVPIRVVPLNEAAPDGGMVTRHVFAEYSDDEAMALLVKYARSEGREFAVTDAEVALARSAGLLGGGAEFAAARAAVADPVTNPRGSFLARRASLWFHYGDRVETFLREQGIADMEMLLVERLPSEAIETLRPFFTAQVADWAYGRGEYAAIVGGENELILPQVATERQEFLFGIGRRMAADFLASHRTIVFHAVRVGDELVNASIEGQLIQQWWQLVKRERGRQALQLAAAVEDGYQAARDAELADAMHDAFAARRDAARVAAPRVHVSPRIAAGNEVQFLVSVVADPDSLPGPYRTEVAWRYTLRGDSTDLHATVRIRSANGRQVGEPAEFDIGTVIETPPEEPAPPAPDPQVELCSFHRPAESGPVTLAGLDPACEDGPPLIYDNLVLYLTPARDTQQVFAWRVVKDDGTEAATGISDTMIDRRMVRAGAGAPGRYAVPIFLWTQGDGTTLVTHDRGTRPGAGRYTVQTCRPQIETGLFGTAGSWNGCLDDWQDEGSFEVEARALHFRGFIAEQGKILPGNEGELGLELERNGTAVELVGVLTALPQYGGGEYRGTLTMTFPERLDLQQQVLGVLPVALRSSDPQVKWTVRISPPIAAAGEPPTRAMSGDLTAALGVVHAPVRDPMRFADADDFASRGWTNEGSSPRAELHFHFPMRNAPMGVPSDRFARLIRDASRNWYVPVAIGGPREQDRLFGYAIYGVTNEPYTGPSPQAPPTVKPMQVAAVRTSAFDAPDLAGLRLEAARSVLDSLGVFMLVGTGRAAESPADEGIVQDQHPLNDSTLAVVIPRPFGTTTTVPHVVGLSEEAATERIFAAELSVTTVRGDPAPSRPLAGTVAQQDRTEGDTVPAGASLTITVYQAFDERAAARAEEAAAERERIRTDCRTWAESGISARRRGALVEALTWFRRAQGAGCANHGVTGLETSIPDLEERIAAEERADAARRAEECRRWTTAAVGARDRGNFASAETWFRRAFARNCSSQVGIDLRQAANDMASRVREQEAAAARERERIAAAEREAEAARQRERERDARQAEDCRTWVDEGTAARSRGDLRGARAWWVRARSAGCAAHGVQGLDPAIVELDDRIRQQETRRDPIPPPPPRRQLDDVDQQLADIVVREARTILQVWDHQSEDGDIVSIAVNGVVVRSRLMIRNARERIPITLNPYGENIIEIFAHNEGRSSPNTASIRVEGARRGGNQQWNLKTNERAAARVVVQP